MTALIGAAEKGHTEVAEALIKAKANIDAQDKVRGVGRGREGGGRMRKGVTEEWWRVGERGVEVLEGGRAGWLGG